MGPAARFDQEVLDRIDAIGVIRIETVIRGSDGQTRPTPIWVVVDDGEVFVRSVRGPRGRWYRDLIVEPRATLRAGTGGWTPVEVVAVPAPDPGSVERCSAALTRKYGDDPALGSMLRPATLETTMRLDPPADDAPA